MKKQIEEMANVLLESSRQNRKGDDRNQGYAAFDEDTIFKYGCDRLNGATALYNADYRKQKEGHWFILEHEYFTCSECGHYHPNGCDSTKEAKERLADGEYPNFCSNCGAKMKKG